MFHMASPFMLVTDNVMRDLIRPAVEGVRNVLEACSASGRPSPPAAAGTLLPRIVQSIVVVA